MYMVVGVSSVVVCSGKEKKKRKGNIGKSGK
jgi:hypothetical protein